MAWVELTSAIFRSRLSSVEFNTLTEESAAPETKLTEILGQVAADVVSRVNAGRRKRGLSPAVDTGLYVPPGSPRHAYTLARQLLTDAFPSLAQYNGEDRKAAVDAAEKYLEDIASNNVDSDDAGGDEYVAGTSSSFRSGGNDLLDFISFQ